MIAAARSMLLEDLKKEAEEKDEAWLSLAKQVLHPDLIKIDVDHADCSFLEALLDVFEPLLLFVEINPLFPPPFIYRETWQGPDNVQDVRS